MSAEKQELSVYRFNRAKATLSEAEWNLEKQFLSSAVNRIYYASFYAVTALLVWDDLDAKTHNGVRQQFGLHYVKTGIVTADSGRFYSDIFFLRHKGDYDDFVEFERKDVLDLLVAGEKLLFEIEAILLRK